MVAVNFGNSNLEQPTLADPAVFILMYFIMPLWLAAGFADWICHRATHIETTTGAKESLIHLLMFAEVGAPLLAAIFLQINALIMAVMIVAFFLHEATAIWDVSYATSARLVTPIEQHVHSFLEMIPLMGILIVVILHWSQALSLLGRGSENARFDLTWKTEPLPAGYVVSAMVVIILFEFLPYLEELIRGVRANGDAWTAPRGEKGPTKRG